MNARPRNSTGKEEHVTTVLAGRGQFTSVYGAHRFVRLDPDSQVVELLQNLFLALQLVLLDVQCVVELRDGVLDVTQLSGVLRHRPRCNREQDALRQQYELQYMS